MVRHWLQLALTDGLGPILAHRLVEAAATEIGLAATDERSVVHAVDNGPALLRRVSGIGRNIGAISAALARAAVAAEQEMEKARNAGVRLVCLGDGEYPALLKSVPGPPLVLFVKGSFEDRDLHSLGVVGSRRCSHYGREQAERLSASAAAVGVTIISGGARGIDSSSHRGALAHPRGRTVAVLGCGVDVAYPPENADLFARIADGRGAVVSEYPLGTPPLAENFPRRNRIISGLSRAVLVVEADERSGALITARYAGDEHGRAVLCLPGRIDNPLSAGPHALIRDGATLVSNVGEILEAMGPLPEQAVTGTLFDQIEEDKTSSPEMETAPAGPAFSSRQNQILDAIIEESTVEQIIERSGLEAGVVLQELTLLSIRGAARRLHGQVFSRKKP